MVCHGPNYIKAACPHVDPFNAKCRAFGRLQESGSEWDRGCRDMRQGFLCKDGRPVPIRCILKAYRQVVDDSEETKALTVELADKMFWDIVELQQLGVCDMDVALRQYVNGKIADFSIAMTVPHFAMNPELNPSLPASAIATMEKETFISAIADFIEYDTLLWLFPNELEGQSKSLWAFSNEQSYKKSPVLRSTEARSRVYTHVDPRRYDWKNPGSNSNKQLKRRLRKGVPKAKRQRLSRLIPQVPRWYLRDDAHNSKCRTAQEVKTYKLGILVGFRSPYLMGPSQW